MSDDTIRQLKEEEARLDQEKLRIKAEIAKLEPPDSKPAQNPYGGLEKQTWEVLKLFFDNAGQMSVRMIAGHLSLEQSVAHHHVDILFGVGFIGQQGRDYTMLRVSGHSDPMFIIGPLGRAFYVAHRAT
jgi:hypothetical protein